MAAVSIEIGTKVDLVAMVKSKETKDAKVYKSQVLEVIDNQHFQIATPIEGYKILLLPVGERFEATFYNGPKIYICQVRITDRYKVRNQYVTDIETVTSLKKFQRREYFRLEYTRDMEYHLPENGEEVDSKTKETQVIEEIPRIFDKGILLDISGGGCRFTSREKIASGEKLLIRIPLEGEEKKILTVIGKVLSSRLLESHGRSHEQRVEFVEISTETREEIIKFVFEQERKNRKNRKS